MFNIQPKIIRCKTAGESNPLSRDRARLSWSSYWNVLKITMINMLKCSIDICVPLKFVCWNLSPQCDGIRSGLWEVVRSWGRALMNGISALRDPRELSSCLSSMWGCNKKLTVCNPEGPRRNLTMLALQSQIFSLQHFAKNNFCFL
jgi:hypothetical protein